MDVKRISHEEATIRSFRKDPAFARAYLADVLEDGSPMEIRTALRRVAKAQGMQKAPPGRKAC